MIVTLWVEIEKLDGSALNGQILGKCGNTVKFHLSAHKGKMFSDMSRLVKYNGSFLRHR
jgi:hypothetical protein